MDGQGDRPAGTACWEGVGITSVLTCRPGRQLLWAESLIWDPGAEFCQRREGSPGTGTCFQQAQIQRKICF